MLMQAKQTVMRTRRIGTYPTVSVLQIIQLVSSNDLITTSAP
jgi:hypothetical protein